MPTPVAIPQLDLVVIPQRGIGICGSARAGNPVAEWPTQ